LIGRLKVAGGLLPLVRMRRGGILVFAAASPRVPMIALWFWEETATEEPIQWWAIEACLDGWL